jgi:hypothetical protein
MPIFFSISNPLSNNIETTTYNDDIELNEIYIRSSTKDKETNNIYLILDNPNKKYQCTDGSLLECLKDYHNVIIFLYLTTIISPDYDSFTLIILKQLSINDIIKKIGYLIYFLFFRVSVITVFFIHLFLLIIDINQINKFYFVYILKSFAEILFLGTIMFMMYSMYIIGTKLNQQSYLVNIPYFLEYLGTTYKFLVICIIMSIPWFLNPYECKK